MFAVAARHRKIARQGRLGAGNGWDSTRPLDAGRELIEPVGRLDVLDGVGARVLAYYAKAKTDRLDDAIEVGRRAGKLIGRHGSLTSAEMLVPLLCHGRR